MRDDRRLIRDYLAGSDAAFEALFDRHGAALFSFAYHLLGRRQDAEDLCQSAWVEAIRSLGSFQGRSAFRTWLHGIALNLYRNQRRRVRPEFEELEAELLATAAEADPQAMAERRESARDLCAALARLDPAQREVVILREVQGFTYREIAALLNCPLGTVKSRLHYALAALRAALTDPTAPVEVDHELRPRSAGTEGV
jgi:RNA polymerase sigma factor (sigma-70 family)